jgi:hypothetical protein
MNEVMIEDFISPKRAQAIMSCSSASFRRYISQGCHGVILRSALIGGKRVPHEWIQEFIQQRTAAYGRAPLIAAEIAAARETDEQEMSAARERLRAAGVME